MASTNRKTAARKLAREANIPYQKALKAVLGEEPMKEAAPPQEALWWQLRSGPLSLPDRSFDLYGDDEFPLGRDAAGKEIVLNLSQTPHLLVIGPTGSGRTIPVRSMVLRALANHTWRACLIDLKRTEFHGFHGHPAVLSIASDLSAAVDMLRACEDEMQQRYVAMHAKSVSHFAHLANVPKRLLIVIDEAYPLFNGKPGGQDEALALQSRILMESVARLGRAAGVHLVVSSARPLQELGPAAETLASFDARIVMGSADEATIGLLMSGDAPTAILSTKGGAMMQRTGPHEPTLDAFGVYWMPKPTD